MFIPQQYLAPRTIPALEEWSDPRVAIPTSTLTEQVVEGLFADGYWLGRAVLPVEMVQRLEHDVRTLSTVSKGGADYDARAITNESQSARSIAAHPLLLTIAAEVVGADGQLRTAKGLVRGPTSAELTPHTDTGVWWKEPLPRAGSVLTAMVPCTPFTTETGCTFVCPRTHLQLRDPDDAEGRAAPRIALEGDVGDLFVWLGETWHGRYARHRADADRVSAAFMYVTADTPAASRTM